jgi:RNA polymerase sigma-70 factor, ECF subfamily
MAVASEPRSKNGALPQDFERVFREHYAFVHRTAHRITGNSSDAEDVLQTLFLRLLRRDFSRELGTKPKAYLYRATVNIALDVIRSRQRDSFVNDRADLLEARESGTPSRGEDEILCLLRAALAELNPRAVEILILRHVHGYTDVEIAKLLGTTRGTIAVSLFRTRARLRKSIRGYLENV